MPNSPWQPDEMSSHDHNRASQATEIQAQLQTITRNSPQQGGPSHVTLSSRIPAGSTSRRPSHGSRQRRAMQPSTRHSSVLQHRGVTAQPRSSTYPARLNGHRNRVRHAPPALSQSLSQNDNQNQSNYASSSLHDPYHDDVSEQSQPTHSKYPPHVGVSDYYSARGYQPLDGDFPVTLVQNRNTALLVQPNRYEGDHQQPQQDYGKASSQLQHNGTNGSREPSGVKRHTMPKVPPGLPIDDPFTANPELMGAGIYNRGINVSGFPPPLLPYDASFLPLPAGSAGTHHGGALEMDFSNRYHPYPLGTHQNYEGGIMGGEANGYPPPPQGAGYQGNMDDFDANEGKNGNKHHPSLGGDGIGEQYGNHQMSNNAVVDQRHQHESRALLYDPEIPLPSIETDEYKEWVNSRQQLQDPFAADFDEFVNYD